MNELARRVIESLQAGRTDAQDLARAGTAEPAEDLAAFGAAARHPALAGQSADWAPALLASAQPGAGARRLVAIADACRAAGREPPSLREHPLLARLVGNSGFLAGWLLREPGWLADLRGPLAPTPPRVAAGADWPALRGAKYRGLLRIAARDLAGRPFAAALAELSELADACLARGARAARRARRGRAAGPPRAREARRPRAQLLARTSISCSSTTRRRRRRRYARNRGRRALVQALKRRLEAREARRLRLSRGSRACAPRAGRRAGELASRPRSPTTSTFGADWERQMLIRLRRLGGPPRAASAFARGIEPFVYRRSIDPSVMRAVREMKARIERERREAGRDLDADLKEGPGRHPRRRVPGPGAPALLGGRDPTLRTGQRARRDRGARPGRPPAGGDPAVALDAGYLWLRRAEHALQLAEERRPRSFPRDARRRSTALARRMGYLRARGETARAALLEPTGARVRERGARALRSAGARRGRAVSSLAARSRRRWPARAFAGRSAAGRGAPRRAARRRRGGTPLSTAPRAARGLARAARDAARQTARYLSNRPQLARARRRARRAQPRRARRRARAASGAREADLEDALDALRLLPPRGDGARGVRRSRGAARLRGDLATSCRSSPSRRPRCARALARRACAALRGAEAFAVVGMGKLAGREFTYHSDLDLIFLYRGGNEEIDARLAARPAPDRLSHDR